MQRWNKAEKNSCRDRKQQREGEHAPVGAQIKHQRNVARQANASHGAIDCGSEEYACYAATERNEKTLGEQLSNESSPTCANREPHCNFTPPFRRTRQQQIGKIHAREQNHERTHACPQQDRMRLLEATAADVGPLFMLVSDPDGALLAATEPRGEPIAEARDLKGETHRLWRITDDPTIARVQSLMATRSVIIADGHHRYETARVYADEIGGEGPHRYVLMCLVALQDEGLTVFPTHRLLTNVKDSDTQVALGVEEVALRIHAVALVAQQARLGLRNVKFGRLVLEPVLGPVALQAGGKRRLQLHVIDLAALPLKELGVPVDVGFVPRVFQVPHVGEDQARQLAAGDLLDDARTELLHEPSEWRRAEREELQHLVLGATR